MPLRPRMAVTGAPTQAELEKFFFLDWTMKTWRWSAVVVVITPGWDSHCN